MAGSLEIKQEDNSAKNTQELKTKILSGNSVKANPLNVHRIIMEHLKKNKSQFRKLIKVAYAVRRGLKQDYDWVSALSGREGSGKSTLLIILLAIIDVQFTLERNLALLPDTGEVKRMFRKTRRYGGLGIDEAIKALFKQDWYKDVQKEIVKMYATERFQNKATVVAIPRFKDLNENFRNHRINCWLHVYERGIAFMYIPIDIPYFPDPWFMVEMEKKYQALLKRKKGANITIEDMLRVERNNPCFVDIIEFPDLPAEVKEVYLRLKIEARDQENNENQFDTSLDKDQIRRAMALQIVKMREAGKKKKDIADEFGLTESMVKTLSKEGHSLIKKKLREGKKETGGEWTLPS